MWFSSHPASNCLQRDGECLSGSHLLHYKFPSLNVTFHELTHADLSVQLRFSSLSHTPQPDPVARRPCTKPHIFPFPHFAPAILLGMPVPSDLACHSSSMLNLSIVSGCLLQLLPLVPGKLLGRLGPTLPKHSVLTSSPACSHCSTYMGRASLPVVPAQ